MNRFYPKWTRATDAAAGLALEASCAAATVDKWTGGRWGFLVTVVYIVVTERRWMDC